VFVGFTLLYLKLLLVLDMAKPEAGKKLKVKVTEEVDRITTEAVVVVHSGIPGHSEVDRRTDIRPGWSLAKANAGEDLTF